MFLCSSKEAYFISGPHNPISDMTTVSLESSLGDCLPLLLSSCLSPHLLPTPSLKQPQMSPVSVPPLKVSADVYMANTWGGQEASTQLQEEGTFQKLSGQSCLAFPGAGTW